MNGHPCFELRPATPDDIPQLLELIRALAQFEQLTHLLECTPERLHDALFGPKPAAQALIAWTEAGSVAAGFALFFHNYSTFLGRRGLYLEDLYVRPEYRGRGCGKALLIALARLAQESGCGRFEWSVLDWNEPAIRVYDAIGAEPQSEWIRYRLAGDKLKALAAG